MRWYKKINAVYLKLVFRSLGKGDGMYGLFYMGYMLFGGVSSLLLGVQIMDSFRQREEEHTAQVRAAMTEGYWTGYGQAWPAAWRNGEEYALQICQMLAMESADMVGMNQPSQQEFEQLVQSWPDYVLSPIEFPHEVGL